VTVSVASVDGVGDVLVDPEGAALYASDEEAGGSVLCLDSCATTWLPLTVTDGEPTGSDGLDADLGVVTRPDGTRQVAFRDHPLYSFVKDSGAGTVTGNGLADSFDDQELTWHVVTPTGVSTSDTNSEEPGNPDDGYSGGGYGR
jgi:predicted lipoprotein with Yx(FWY)xxD motif